MMMMNRRSADGLILAVLLGCLASVVGGTSSPSSSSSSSSFSPSFTPPQQEVLRRPVDQQAIQGEHVTLPCQVKNKRGMLQWTRDGFGLGIERNLTGFDRYRMVGGDEEGERAIDEFAGFFLT